MTNSTRTVDRRTLFKLAGASGAMLASSLASPAQIHATPATPLATPESPDYETAVDDTMRSLSIPGANVLVARQHEPPWSAAFGVSDIESGAPMTVDMHMRIGSATKSMTGTVVLQLVDEGAIGLEDTLAAALPERADFPNADRITIRNLLGMTSGVFDLLDDETVFPRIMDDPARAWTPDEMVDIVATHEPNFAPGDDTAYSNTNYILLGMILERVTGQTAADLLDRYLFAPLGMADTSLPSTPPLPTPFARGYSVDPSGESDELIDWTGLNPTVAWTAGGVVSTVGDLNVWLRALLDGTLISESLQRERMTFTHIRPGYDYGLGIANYDGMVGHEGSILGYQCFAGRDESTGDSVIALANLDPNGTDNDSATTIAGAIRQELRG